MYMREKTRIRLHQNEIPKERGNIIQRQKEREGEESKIISNHIASCHDLVSGRHLGSIWEAPGKRLGDSW